MGVKDRIKIEGYWFQGSREQNRQGGQNKVCGSMGAWVMGSEWKIKDVT